MEEKVLRGPRVPFPEIIRAEVGSSIHGIALEGKDDRDEMGVCIESSEYVIGLEVFEQYEYRSARERTGIRDEPSKSGDLDLVVYSLRKYLRLAMKGNPTVLLPFFVSEDRLVIQTELGKELQSLAPAVVSKRSGEQFLGYLRAQKQRLLRERGTAKVPNRGDHHAKYASHILRLGLQGKELMMTGWITLPMPEQERDFVVATKKGEVDFNEVLTRAGELERDLEDLVTANPLRDEPDRGAINAFLRDAHERVWSGTD